MLALRTLGSGFLLVALIALIFDIATALFGSSGFAVTALGKLWFTLHSSSLNGLQAGIQRFVSPYLWDPVISSILQMPVWSALGALGLLSYGLSFPKLAHNRSKTNEIVVP